MKNLITSSALSFALLTTFNATAQTNKQALAERLTQLTKLEVIAIEEAPIANFVQLVTPQGIFYASEDGKHIISGGIHEFSNGFRSLTNERMGAVRGQAIKELEDTFITYRSPSEEYEVIVFYDPTCPFCRRMHENIDSYLNQGITIHYAAFPRGGINTASARQLDSIFCADNPKSTLDNSIVNTPIPPKVCTEESPVASHYALGEQLGVRGTPAIYTLNTATAIDGGALPANQLRGRLDAL
ncbi:thioredoxin fold domain-containing protein [Aliidiomarina quisquiliarum]|uniref:thioredoxin fold domain-containing protein n=1 Tax=Aliidiomarina quisquiliarum TaxID=2938947 RepID=UPI00208F85FE|nr:thioredoxin fold domain-containing protein [Aliidiomarina quisquiliarum]MCO4319897.1 thioredoxin fold domain-containing protein [Aliidiomarina quisquiliarum]